MDTHRLIVSFPDPSISEAEEKGLLVQMSRLAGCVRSACKMYDFTKIYHGARTHVCTYMYMNVAMQQDSRAAI